MSKNMKQIDHNSKNIKGLANVIIELIVKEMLSELPSNLAKRNSKPSRASRKRK